MLKGVVSIVGRPNVGKSTLFNRLTRSTKAIVDDMPGVTRDKIYGVFRDEDDEDSGFFVIDTGGFETKGQFFQPFSENLVWKQSVSAIEESNVVVMLLDSQSGVHPHDKELVRYLEQLNKPVVYAVNKVDHKEHRTRALEFYELGIDPLIISASHGTGVDELIDRLKEILSSDISLNFVKSHAMDAIHVAIIGKPNVGKSSILNRLVGEERSIVSDIAGTTRDPVDTPFVYNKKNYLLIDTAGVRRKSKVKEKLESITVIKSLQAIERADIVVLVVSAEDGLSDQDAKLCSIAIDRFKPVLIVVNKWDLFKDKESNSQKAYRDAVSHAIKDMSFVPVHFTSCSENKRIFDIMKHVEILSEQYQKRVSTATLNELLQKVAAEHTPALIRSRIKRVKFYYATQVKTAPPTIVVMCNFASELQESYKRYMKKRFQTELGFDNIPIYVIFRNKSNRE